MPNSLRVIHGVLALLVLLLAGYAAATTLDHPLFPQWQVLGILVGSYAAGHLWLVLRGSVSASLVASFYVLMPVLAIASLQAVGGHAKQWAPAAADEAQRANLFWFGLLSVVASACALTFLLARKPKAEAGSRPSPG